MPSSITASLPGSCGGKPSRSRRRASLASGKLRGWYESYSPGSALTIDNKPFAVTPHLICSHQSTSSFYALISDSGRALFVDYGSASWNVFDTFNKAAPVNDRMRFVEHTIPELKARYGMKSVDVAMPS